MKDSTVEAIERLFKAAIALHPIISIDDEKQQQLYHSLHEVHSCVEDETGVKISLK